MVLKLSNKLLRHLRGRLERKLFHINSNLEGRRIKYAFGDSEKEDFVRRENELKKTQILPENSSNDTEITYPLIVGGADLSYTNALNNCSEAVICYVIAQYRLPHQQIPEIIYKKWKEVDISRYHFHVKYLSFFNFTNFLLQKFLMFKEVDFCHFVKEDQSLILLNIK